MESWKSPITPLIWFGIGTLLFVILLASYILIVRGYIFRIKKELEEKNQIRFNYQRELIRACIETQENERLRISGTLHDDLISQLRRLQLMIADHSLDDLLQKIISTTRMISHDLSPPLLHTMHFEDLITDFLNPMKDKYDICFYHHHSESYSMNKEKRLHLYRIFQEVVSNIMTHAQAKGITIHLRTSKKMMFLSVRDNGLGYDVRKSQGLGLRNIELRADLIQARYKIHSLEDQGTLFSILLRNERES